MSGTRVRDHALIFNSDSPNARTFAASRIIAVQSRSPAPPQRQLIYHASHSHSFHQTQKIRYK